MGRLSAVLYLCWMVMYSNRPHWGSAELKRSRGALSFVVFYFDWFCPSFTFFVISGLHLFVVSTFICSSHKCVMSFNLESWAIWHRILDDGLIFQILRSLYASLTVTCTLCMVNTYMDDNNFRLSIA